MSLTPKALKGEADSERHMYERALGQAAGAAGSEPALSVEKVMNHGLVQPYKQTTPSGSVRANPSYLPASTLPRWSSTSSAVPVRR